jgi:hypothetical protein
VPIVDFGTVRDAWNPPLEFAVIIAGFVKTELPSYCTWIVELEANPIAYRFTTVPIGPAVGAIFPLGGGEPEAKTCLRILLLLPSSFKLDENGKGATVTRDKLTNNRTT